MVDRDNEQNNPKPEDDLVGRNQSNDLPNNSGDQYNSPPVDFSNRFDDTYVPYENLEDRNEDDVAINAIPTDQSWYQEPPDHVLQEQREVVNSFANENPNNRFHAFLVEKFRDLTNIARGRNADAVEIDHSSSFKKNEQTQWFKEYNEMQADKTLDKDVIFCKPNGFFYTDSESNDLVTALEKLGLSELEAKKASNSFEFAFIGNTESRNATNSTFQAYVIKSKDPKTPDILDQVKLLQDRKEELVQNYLSKHANLDTALEKYYSAKEGIIKADFDKTGYPALVSSGDIDFLNKFNLKKVLDEVPEIKGKYKIEKLESDDNEFKFTGYSSGLSSYFSDKLALHKVIPIDGKGLSQSDLEGFVHEKFKGMPKDSLLNETPANQDSIINRQQEKVNQKNDQTNEVKGPDNNGGKGAKPSHGKLDPLDPKSPPKSSNNDQGGSEDKKRSKRPQESQEEESMTLGEVIADTAKQLSKEALRVLIELALMILKLILALLKATASLALATVKGDFKSQYSQIKNDFKNDADISKNFENIIQNSYLKGGLNKSPSEQNASKESSLTHDQVQNSDNSLKARIERKQLEDESVKVSENKFTYSPVSAAKDIISNLSVEKKDELTKKAIDTLKNNTVESNLGYKDLIKIPSLHGHASTDSDFLPSKFVNDDKFGVLLNKYDEVIKPDGEKGAILSAFSANDELNYAVVSNDTDGNYNVDFLKAEDVNLSKCNAYKFDNEEYLLEKMTEKLKNSPDELSVANIEFLDLHDYSNSPVNLTSLEDYLQKNDCIDYSKIKDLQTKTVGEILKENDPDFSIRNLTKRQLHSIDSPELMSNSVTGSIHPVFGLLLDVNDKVSSTLKESSVGIEGTVLGAFNDDGDLKYLVEANKNKYLIDAKDTSLIGKNSGSMDMSEIDKTLRYPEALAKEIKTKLPIIALGHEEFAKLNELNNSIRLSGPSIEPKSMNAIMSSGYSGILNEIPHDKKRVVQDLNTKKNYLIMGGVGDEGLKNVAIEVALDRKSKEFKPIDASKNGFYKIDLDSASIKEIDATINTNKLNNFIQTYNQSVIGADNNTAKQLSHLYAKDSQKLGEELFFAQVMVKEILKDKTLTLVSEESKLNLGSNADFNKSKFNTSELFNRMSNSYAMDVLGKSGQLLAHIPMAFELDRANYSKSMNINDLLKLAQESPAISRMLKPVSDAKIINMPFLDAANDYNKSIPMGKIYNLDEYRKRDSSIKPTEILNTPPQSKNIEILLEQSSSAPKPNASNFDWNTDKQDYQLIKSIVELKNSSMDHSTNSHVADIIRDKVLIEDKFSKLKGDINNTLPQLGDVFSTKGGAISFSNLNNAEFESFKGDSLSRELAIKIANIKSNYDDVSVSNKLNLDKASKRLEDIEFKYNIESISNENKANFTLLIKDMKEDVRKKVDEYLDVGKVVYTLDYIAKNSSDLKLDQLRDFVEQRVPSQQLNKAKDVFVSKLDQEKNQMKESSTKNEFDLNR